MRSVCGVHRYTEVKSHSIARPWLLNHYRHHLPVYPLEPLPTPSPVHPYTMNSLGSSHISGFIARTVTHSV